MKKRINGYKEVYDLASFMNVLDFYMDGVKKSQIRYKGELWFSIGTLVDNIIQQAHKIPKDVLVNDPILERIYYFFQVLEIEPWIKQYVYGVAKELLYYRKELVELIDYQRNQQLEDQIKNELAEMYQDFKDQEPMKTDILNEIRKDYIDFKKQFYAKTDTKGGMDYKYPIKTKSSVRTVKNKTLRKQ